MLGRWGWRRFAQRYQVLWCQVTGQGVCCFVDDTVGELSSWDQDGLVLRWMIILATTH